MKFRKLRIKNFCAIGEADIDLIDRGLVLIQGENSDDTSAVSNGAGKSSIADALCWALYGKTARGLAGDAVVNRTAKKDCRVVVNLEEGNDQYSIIRYRKDSTDKNLLRFHYWPNGVVDKSVTVVTLTEGTEKLTQDKIERVLGCSYEVFRAAIYAGQEGFPDLPGMTDKQLKIMIEEAAGITVLERAYEEARKLVTIGVTVAAEAYHEVELAKSDVMAAEERLRLTRLAETEWETERAKQVNTLMGQARAVKAELQGIEAEAAKIDGPSFELALDALKAQIAGVEGEHKIEQKLAEDVGKAAVAGEIAVNVAERRLTENRAAAVRIQTAAAELQKELAHLKAHGVEKIGTACASCDRTYDHDDLEGLEAALKRRLTDQIAAFAPAKAEFETATANVIREKEARAERIRRAESVLDAHRASMTDISATSASMTAVTTELGKLAALSARAKAVKDGLARILKQAKEWHGAVNPNIAKVEAGQNALSVAEAHLDNREEAEFKVKEAKQLAEAAAKVFGPAGARAEILDTVTPYLNERTAHYLGTLSDGNISAVWTTLTKTAKGELREKFQIEVTHAHGGDDFAAISGGEKRKVRIACALALQDLVASRATKPIDLFIGDEIDDALDTAGLERLMSILEEKARERGTVLIISHGDLKDWIREVITIRKSGGKSTLLAA